MEARLARTALLVAVLLSCCGANYRTQSFVVTADTPQLAKEVGDAAEVFRRDLAMQWLGRELPQWSQPVPLTVKCQPNLGAGGVTSFSFDQSRQPYQWSMMVQGSRERILDSVLPHEIMHTIFATHYGRPLPRWADEGACTTVEHSSERNKQHQFLYQFLKTNRGIPFNAMFAMKEYPNDMLPLYAQGYSLARYLIAQGGHQRFVAYIGEGMQTNNWSAVTKKYYGYQDLSDLQVKWVDWVGRGCPDIRPRAEVFVSDRSGEQSEEQPVYRGQDADSSERGIADRGRLGGQPASSGDANYYSRSTARTASARGDEYEPRQFSPGVKSRVPSEPTASSSGYASDARSQPAAGGNYGKRQTVLEWSSREAAPNSGQSSVESYYQR